MIDKKEAKKRGLAWLVLDVRSPNGVRVKIEGAYEVEQADDIIRHAANAPEPKGLS